MQYAGAGSSHAIMPPPSHYGHHSFDKELQSALEKLDGLTEPLLQFLSPSRAPSMLSAAAPSTLSAAQSTGLGAAHAKQTLLASLAARIQAFDIAKKSVNGALVESVQKEIDALVAQMLEVNKD